MESAVTLAERLMRQYEDRLSLAQISDEILDVLRDGGLRFGDPVPSDLAGEAQQRLEVAAASLPAEASVLIEAGPSIGDLPRPRMSPGSISA
jgi:hypothetical protein